MKQTYIKKSGLWKEVKNIWIRKSGTWKDEVVPKVNVSGTWKDAMEYSSIIITGGTNIYTETIGSDEYKIHEFLTDGTFQITGSTTIDFLIVAGGGGGGVGWGGGAGAGGVVYVSGKTVSDDSYSIVVGDGGYKGYCGDCGNSNTWVHPLSGNSSTFMSYEAIGGGEGSTQSDGGDGGSGGGATYNSGREGYSTQTTYVDADVYGNDGGIKQSQVAGGRASGSGGGSALEQGEQAPDYDNGGDGGDAKDFSNLFGTNVGVNGYFAAGGGGGIGNNSTGSPGSGGLNGGGDGGKKDTSNGTDGSNNGSGGGGGGNEGGFGGNGVVLIRYKV